MVKDIDTLQSFLNDFDKMIYSFKMLMGTNIEKTIKEQIFNGQGPATVDTDPLNPRGVNPKWASLSWITMQLKKRNPAAILIDTHEMFNFVRWQIEDSEFDSMPANVKVGWFEESGNYAYIAAIHEFGLTGQTFNTPDGTIMGGMPIGRTPQARSNIRSWFMRKLGLQVSGRVIIPERSMLRKAADIVDPILETAFNEFLDKFLNDINQF